MVLELDRRHPGLDRQIEESMAVPIDGEIFQDAYLVPLKPEIYLIPKIGGNRARREEPCSSQPDSDELRDGEPVPAYDQAADDRMGQPARVLIPKIGGG